MGVNVIPVGVSTSVTLSPSTGFTGTTPQTATNTSAVLFVSPNGNDSNNCLSTSSPCLTINSAFQKASAGQVIEMAAGNYVGQEVYPSSRALSSAQVVVRPAAGAAVNIAFLRIKGATRLEVQDVRTGSTMVPYVEFLAQQSQYITFRNIKTSYLNIGTGSDIQVIGGEVGPALNNPSKLAPEGPNGWEGWGKNILFDGVWFHDIIRNSHLNGTEPVHTECLQVAGTTNLVIRNSRFTKCDVYGLSITAFNNSGKVKNILIENNFFEAATDHRTGGNTGGSASLNFTQFDGGIIRFNSFVSAISVSNSSLPSSKAEFYGNIVPAEWLCHRDLNYSYNVLYHPGWGSPTNTGCGPTNRYVPLTSGSPNPGFTSSTDLHLKTNAFANNLVPSSLGHPSTDFDGQPRSGSLLDAGADETDGSAPIGGGGGGGGGGIITHTTPTITSPLTSPTLTTIPYTTSVTVDWTSTSTTFLTRYKDITAGTPEVQDNNKTTKAQTFDVIPGNTYKFWVHAGTLTDSNYSTQAEINFTVDTGATSTYTLSTTTKNGTIIKSVGGINTTETTFNAGTVVTLTATPSTNYTFSAWTGCSPSTTNPNVCTVTMDADKTSTATFTPISTGRVCRLWH